MSVNIVDKNANASTSEYNGKINPNNLEISSYKNETKFDDGKSGEILEKTPSYESADDLSSMYNGYLNDDLYKMTLHASNLFTKSEINLYDNIYRFGLFNPYGAVKGAREYLFFTKPDLNIIQRTDTGLVYSNGSLNESVQNISFWKELHSERPNTIRMLQESYSPGWNMLLQNSVVSNLEIPGLEGTVIESPTNNYGVGFQYRGTSEASDDSLEFALEFKDTKWLDVYYFFKAYEEYETLKHHGTVSPWRGYITNRILHDQFAIYKFMVDEDMETIIYYCKLYGVMPMNLPRDVFSTADFSSGLSYTINFKAAFFEDMRRDILIDFNNLSTYYENKRASRTGGSGAYYHYETYNPELGTIDYRPAKSAYVQRYQNPDSPTGWVYKLKWKGDKQI